MTFSVPYSFVPGTKAKAQEVNANFNSVAEQIDATNILKLNKDCSNISQQGLDVIKNSISGKCVGELVFSTIPLNDRGLHLLDGSLLRGNGVYSDFVDYIANLYTSDSTANYFCTETDWQQSVTDYGSCGKFVYDSTNNTVRLPKVSDILQGTTDLSALGDLVEAGLPVHTHTRGSMNITGEFQTSSGDDMMMKRIASYSGAFTPITGWNSHNGTNDNGQNVTKGFNFDASRSWTGSTSAPSYTDNIQNSSTVQPQTIKYMIYIVVATSAKSELIIDIDNIATDLNGKADTDLSNITESANVTNKSLSNVNNSGKILMSGMGMPSNTYNSLAIGASGTTYTAPTNGYFYIHGDSYNNSNFHAITVFYNSANSWDTPVIRINQPATSAGAADLIPVKKGQTIRIEFSDMTMKHVIFVYAVGSESEAS